MNPGQFQPRTTEDYARDGIAFRFRIDAPPITKKNSQQMAMRKNKLGKPLMFPVPSAQAREWSKFAIQVIRAQAQAQGFRGAWTGAVSVQCLFLRRAAAKSDLNNYTSIVGDALQEAGVLANDHQIRSWDGSRMGVSYVLPRTEIILRPMPTPAMMVELEPETSADAKRRNATRRANLRDGAAGRYPLEAHKWKHAPTLMADRELARELKIPQQTYTPLKSRMEQGSTPELLKKDDLTLEHTDPLTPELDQLLAGLHDTEE